MRRGDNLYRLALRHDTTVAAMAELGYDGARVRFDELEDRVHELSALFTRITH